MILTKKVQIYPDHKTREKLWGVSCLCKDLWNAAVEQRRDPKTWGKVNIYSQKKELPFIKKEFCEYKVPSSQVLQNVLYAVESAYQMFFTKRRKGDQDVRPPKFKSYRDFFAQRYSQWKTSFIVTAENVLKLAYGTKPSEWLEIKLPASIAGNPKTCTICLKDKKWYACFTYEVDEPTARQEGPALYFDPGCITTLAGIKTSGQFIQYDINPLRKVNIETYRLIDQLTSVRDKTKKKGSYRWRRLNSRIKKLYSKINTRTKMYLHKLANRILIDHPEVRIFRVGDWEKQHTLADTGIEYVNRQINRAVQNNNPVGKLIEYLAYKVKLKSQACDKFDERGSTRTCPRCNHINPGVPPAQRTFVCEKCSFTYPRDHKSCLSFIKSHESAVWRRLCDSAFAGLDRSVRTSLHPFSLKPQVSVHPVPLPEIPGSPSIH
jgi:putative transposase